MFKEELGEGEMVGQGREKRLYPSPVNPQGEVWATFNRDSGLPQFKSAVKESERQTESRYYFQKVLHFLFPESIPDAIGFFPVSPASIRMERREHDPLHKEMNSLAFEIEENLRKDEKVDSEKLSQYLRLKKDRKTHPAVLALVEKFKSVGIEKFDKAGKNFSLNSAGIAQYLDNMPAWQSDSLVFSPEKMRVAIEHLSEPAKSEALKYLQRILELFNKDMSARTSQS